MRRRRLRKTCVGGELGVGDGVLGHIGESVATVTIAPATLSMEFGAVASVMFPGVHDPQLAETSATAAGRGLRWLSCPPWSIDRGRPTS